MARYESTRDYGGKEVEVFADEFDYGPGMPYWPLEIWAKYNGVEFPLTEEQEIEIGTSAVEYVTEGFTQCE